MAGGRWNPKGIRMVYTSASVALAMLETLVHVHEVAVLMKRHVALAVEADDDLALDLDEALEQWSDIQSMSESDVGRRWVQEQLSPILRVPSVIVPTENNYLINPLHPDFAKLRIGDPMTIPFDPRLKQLGNSK